MVETSMRAFEMLSITPNNRVNSDCQKRRGFRYAPATPLLAAGYAKRWALKSIKARFSVKGRSVRTWGFPVQCGPGVNECGQAVGKCDFNSGDLKYR